MIMAKRCTIWRQISSNHAIYDICVVFCDRYLFFKRKICYNTHRSNEGIWLGIRIFRHRFDRDSPGGIHGWVCALDQGFGAVRWFTFLRRTDLGKYLQPRHTDADRGDITQQNFICKKDGRRFMGETPPVFFYLDGAAGRRSLREEYRTPNKISAVPAKNSGVIFSCRMRMPSAMEANG